MTPRAEIHAPVRAPPGLGPRSWGGHGYGSSNKEVPQRLSQKSPCVAEGVEFVGNPSSGTCQKITFWNWVDIYYVELAFRNLPHGVLGKFVHGAEGSHCRHSTRKLTRRECSRSSC